MAEDWGGTDHMVPELKTKQKLNFTLNLKAKLNKDERSHDLSISYRIRNELLPILLLKPLLNY